MRFTVVRSNIARSFSLYILLWLCPLSFAGHSDWSGLGRAMPLDRSSAPGLTERMLVQHRQDPESNEHSVEYACSYENFGATTMPLCSSFEDCNEDGNEIIFADRNWEPEYACSYRTKSSTMPPPGQACQKMELKDEPKTQEFVQCSMQNRRCEAKVRSSIHHKAQANNGKLGSSKSLGAINSIQQGGLRDPKGSEESMWREDVGKRYRELVPPKPKRVSSTIGGISEAGMRDAMARSFSAELRLTEQKVDEVVMFLDLDKCTIFGNDGNDLGIALQWMEKPYEDVVELYRHLVNPCLKPAYEKLKSKAHKVKVVIYTMRATFLLYKSCFRPAVIVLQWYDKWHRDGQIYFPNDVNSADELLEKTNWHLLDEERTDIKKSLERLLAARQVVFEELGLECLPDLVVTAQPKNVEKTGMALGYNPQNCFLWDDNPKLHLDPKVLGVPPYEEMLEDRQEKLLNFLNECLPPEQMEEDLWEFMLGAGPCDASLREDSVTGDKTYHVKTTKSLDPWPIPEFRASEVSAKMRKAGLAEEGTLSPVTPDSESSPLRPKSFNELDRLVGKSLGESNVRTSWQELKGEGQEVGAS
mmetsp:Transcript_49279/g.154603  ORF Transcript_49279/g.154603 Transcript_49279/m.154603 type:complete len:586 (+) Transcript_49279:313-2070(+)